MLPRKDDEVKLITERSQVREVAAKWAEQYPPNGPYGRDSERQAIAKALAALDVETATAADVAAIIGNNLWCRPSTCHECGKAVAVAVQVGEDPDCESSTATLCFACVEKALALMTDNVQLMDLIDELRTASKGTEEWRVADPTDGSYCMTFIREDTINPERAAREWLADHRQRFPKSPHANFEVRRVMAQSRDDLLMSMAAGEIERLQSVLAQNAKAVGLADALSGQSRTSDGLCPGD